MEKEIILRKLAAIGFPNGKFKAWLQFTQENSLLCKRLGRDAEPFILDNESLEESGLVCGIRTQKGHKSLYSWDRILDVF